jgi:hypothetical protein
LPGGSHGLLGIYSGAMISALAGINEPLEALEGDAGSHGGVSEITGRRFHIFTQEGAGRLFPETGLHPAHATEAPFVSDEGAYEETLCGIGQGAAGETRRRVRRNARRIRWA